MPQAVHRERIKQGFVIVGVMPNGRNMKDINVLLSAKNCFFSNYDPKIVSGPESADTTSERHGYA